MTGVMADRLKRTALGTLAFLILVFIYRSNGVAIWAFDTFGSSSFAANLVQHGTIYFDAVAEHKYLPLDSYFLANTKSGHIASVYPLLPQLIYAPLNFLYYSVAPACNAAVFTAEFEPCRLGSDKFSSAILAATAALIFYRISIHVLRRKSSAVLATVFFAVGTNHFVTASQSNWQHGPTELLCLLAMAITLGAWRFRETDILNVHPTVLASFALSLIFGLLVWLRITNLIWALPLLLWAAIQRREVSGWQMLAAATAGLAIAALGFVWNYHEFGSVLGGYSKPRAAAKADLLELSLRRFADGVSGLLWSPSRGLLLITPVAALGILYWPRVAFDRILSKRFILTAWVISAIGLITAYCFYKVWWAGMSTGARFLTDTMPMLVLSAAVAAERIKARLFKPAYIVAGFIGVANQFAFVYGASGHAGQQFDELNFSDPILAHTNWRDPALLRAYLSVYNKLIHPASFWGSSTAAEDSQACILDGASTDNAIAVTNRGNPAWIGYRGGAPNPPRLEVDVSGSRTIFVLRDRYVASGQVGTFVSLNFAARGQSPPEAVIWGDRKLLNRC
jgi:hypothetical protein